MTVFAKRLSVLDFGLFQVKADGRIIGIPGYFIETHGGDKILVDAGFPPWYRDDYEKATRDDGLDAFGNVLELKPDNFPEGQLALVGVKPDELTQLVISHGDIDHIGCMHELAHVPIAVGKAEHEAGPPRYFGGKSRMDWPADATYRLIDDDTDIAPGVTLLPTPGHSPGHLSVRVRLEHTGTVILTCDAINRKAELSLGQNGGGVDQDAARASTKRLQELASAESGWLLYGHDPEQWTTLKKAPEFYD